MADLKLVTPTPAFPAPAGWKLVPLEPTNAMLAAAIEPWRNDPAKKSSTIYKAMVEAAPAYGVLPVEGKSSEHAQLMKFYGVDSLAALVDAQARHVEKLQAKLPPAPSFAPQRVREG